MPNTSNQAIHGLFFLFPALSFQITTVHLPHSEHHFEATKRSNENKKEKSTNRNKKKKIKNFALVCFEAIVHVQQNNQCRSQSSSYRRLFIEHDQDIPTPHNKQRKIRRKTAENSGCTGVFRKTRQYVSD